MEWSVIPHAQLTPPRLCVDLVPRPRLLQPLLAAVGRRRVLLLCAPAGSGKTALLVQLAAALTDDTALCWITVGEDDDLARFVTCLAQALEPLGLAWPCPPQMLPTMALREGGTRQAADMLLQVLAQSGRSKGLIVIDDLQRLPDPRAYGLVEMLVAGVPVGWTVAVGTRVEPPLARSRWLLAGDVVEMRDEQLRFREDEARELRNAEGAPVQPEEVERVLSDTGGWVAGVSLCLRGAAHGLPGQRMLRRQLFEFLAHEVLRSLPESLQEFLLRASLLPELTPSRCAHVCREPAAAAFLADIERRDLFVVAIDAEELTLRLHDLFRDFLEDELLRRHPEEVPLLLTRAADRESDLVARLVYRLRAGDPDTAADDLLVCAASVLNRGPDESLTRLLARFSQSDHIRLPELAFLRGLRAAYRQEYLIMAAEMRRAREGFEQCGRHAMALQSHGFEGLALLQLGEPAQAVAFCARLTAVTSDATCEALATLAGILRSLLDGMLGPVAALLQRLAALVSLLPEWHWPWVVSLLTPLLGEPGLRSGMLALALRLEPLAADDQPRMRTAFGLLRAWLSAWQGELAAAQEQLKEARTDVEWLGRPAAFEGLLQHLSAVLACLQGRPREGCERLARLAEVARRQIPAMGSLRALALMGQLACAAGELELADDALQRTEELCAELGAGVAPGVAALPLLRAEVAAARGHHEQAVALLEPLLGDEGDTPRVRVRVRLSLCRLSQARLPLAWQALAPVLRPHPPEVEPLALMLCGAAALETLLSAAWPASEDRTGLESLSRCLAILRSQGPNTPPGPVGPGVVLTARERQVLECIYAGRSNKVIARDLGLSPHTVKRHLARLFAKTGRNSRGELAAWYRTVRPTAAPPRKVPSRSPAARPPASAPEPAPG